MKKFCSLTKSTKVYGAAAETVEKIQCTSS
jgi:hypothetical protein